MKTSTVGLVSAAILMVVAVVGFGIAHAAGTYADRPVLSFEDHVALEQGSSSSPYVLVSRVRSMWTTQQMATLPQMWRRQGVR